MWKFWTSNNSFKARRNFYPFTISRFLLRCLTSPMPAPALWHKSCLVPYRPRSIDLMLLFQLQWYHSSQIYLGLWSWYCLRRGHENQDICYFIACLNCMICYLLIQYVNYTGECLNSRYYQLKITKACVTVNHRKNKWDKPSRKKLVNYVHSTCKIY